jgi:hypothetical protein
MSSGKGCQSKKARGATNPDFRASIYHSPRQLVLKKPLSLENFTVRASNRRAATVMALVEMRCRFTGG